MGLKTDPELGARRSLCECCILFLNQRFRWQEPISKMFAVK